MASFKTRRKHLSKGGTQIGATGAVVSKLIFGTVSACVPATGAASGVSTGSMLIPDAETGMKFFFTGASMTNGVQIYAASVNSACNVSASYIGASGATIASTLTFHYIGIK